jgi:hypothetical protein
MEQLNGEFLIGMRKGTKFQVFTGLLLENATAVLTLVSLRMVKLLNLIMRQQTSPVSAIPLPRTFQVRVGSILVVTGVGQLARRCFEGLQVESEELVLLQVGQLVGMRPEAVVRPLAVGLTRRGLVDEGMEADLVGVMRVLAALGMMGGVLGPRRDRASAWDSRASCSQGRGFDVCPPASGSRGTRG